jgi:hypothetical protein
LKASGHYNSPIKLLALNELAKRNELTQDVARSLLETSNKETKAFLYKFLIKEGWKPNVDLIRKEFEGLLSAQDDILYYTYNNYSNTELENELDWYNIDVDKIYKILSLRNYEHIRMRILTDLDDNFENFHHIYQEKFKQKYGDQSKTILESWDRDDLKDFIRTRLILSAISAIMEQDDPESIRIARKYIKNNDERIKKMAIKIMEKLGDTSDASLLVDICTKSYGELKELAANAALLLNPGISGTSASFLKIGDEHLINLALKSLKNEPIEKTRSIVENLLQNSNDSIRKHAIFYLIDKLSKDELEKILMNYPKNYYYYNVMCLLDRMLYAPSPLNSIFREGS